MAREFTCTLTREEWKIARAPRIETPAITMMKPTIDDHAKFLDLHPGWSPLLDEKAEVTGFQGPSGVTFPLESIASFLADEAVDAMPAISVAG